MHAEERPLRIALAGLPGQAPRRRPGRLHAPPHQGPGRPRPPRRGARRPAVPRARRPRSRCIELPSLDIYNDHFPMRMPGLWEFKDLGRPRRGRARSRPARSPSRCAFSLRAWRHLRHRRRRLRPRPRQPVPRLRPARRSMRDGWPVLATLHHPITVDRDLELAHAATPGQRLTLRPLVRLPRDADARSPGGCRASSPCRENSLDGHRRAAWASPPTACTSCRSASTRTCSGRCPTSRAVPGRLMTTASADVPLKGLALPARGAGQGAHRARRRAPRRHRQAASAGAAIARPIIERLGLAGRGRVRERRDRRAHRRALRRGRARRRAVALRGLLAAGGRGDGVRRAARRHHRRRAARGRRPRRRDRAARARRATPTRSPPRSAAALGDAELRARIGAAGRAAGARAVHAGARRAEGTVEQYRELLDDARRRAERGRDGAADVLTVDFDRLGLAPGRPRCSTWAAAAAVTRSRRCAAARRVVALDYADGRAQGRRARSLGAMVEAGEVPDDAPRRRRACNGDALAPAVPRRHVRPRHRVRGARAHLGRRAPRIAELVRVLRPGGRSPSRCRRGCPSGSAGRSTDEYHDTPRRPRAHLPPARARAEARRAPGSSCAARTTRTRCTRRTGG